MTRERLVEILGNFKNLHITVAGDLFLDRWYDVDESLNEPSLETGLTAYQVVAKRSAAGAAGTVLNNLSEMGVGHLKVISILGNDGDGWEMLQKLHERRVNTDWVVISDEIVTPSYVKPMFPVEGNRFDIKNFKTTPASIQKKVLENIKVALKESDALILLDQVCEVDTGVLTAFVRDEVRKLALENPDKLIVADSRAFIDLYRDVTIKCNNHEAARMSGLPGDTDEDEFDVNKVFESMDRLHAKNGKPVIITCNKHGAVVEENGVKKLVPAVKQEGPIDVCGAGDASTAGMVSALCAGGSFAEAACVGMLSSGVTCRMLGRTGAASQAAMLALYDEQSDRML